MLAGLCKVIGVFVLLLAILLGLIASGFMARYTPLFTWLDQVKGRRGHNLKGVAPAMHRDVPWGYNFKELAQTDLKDHIVVITGANVGLGYYSALHIAKSGATVEIVLACRSKMKCKDAANKIKAEAGKIVYPMEVDLSSFQSIREFAGEFKKRYSYLDSLMLNAGVMVPPFMKTKEGLESQIGINHFGHFLLTDLLLPLLEEGAKLHQVATVCVVSSAAHYDSYPEGILPSIEAMNDENRYNRQRAYGQSKLANVLFAQELSERVKDKNILVNSIHPGAVRTELGRHALATAAKIIGNSAADYIWSFVIEGMWNASDASLTQIYASVGKTLKEKKITGKYFHPIARETEPDPHAGNRTLQKHLWQITEGFIKEH